MIHARQSNQVILVLGGCRSGKSAHALTLADGIGGEQKIFVATSRPRDQEMRARIARHQEVRGPDWQTEECPLHLSESIKRNRPQADVVLIDCLTLWVSNLLEQQTDEAYVFDSVHHLLKALDEQGCPLLMVSNETGTGTVPENRLARLFRDINGHVNQQMAARADTVIWMVAGIPVFIKGGPDER